MAGGGGGGGAAPARKSKWGSPVPLKRARIEIIPLIDVMFFLLASFMLVSLSLQKAGTFKMTLPAVTTARPDFKPDMLNIGVEKDGRVSVEKKHLSLDELDGILKDMTNGYGADVVLECAGAPAATRLGVQVIRKEGKLTQIGLHDKPFEFDVVQIHEADEQIGREFLSVVEGAEVRVDVDELRAFRDRRGGGGERREARRDRRQNRAAG